MSNSQLLDAIFSGGLRAPHYVNGRLLTAEDLDAEQSATASRLDWLGQATGPGIVQGLMATQVGTTGVRITPGLGLNREGHLLRLDGEVTLSLAPQAGAVMLADEVGRFANCDNSATNGDGPARTEGAYLLAALPVAHYEGQAPLQVPAQSTSPVGCASRWEVDGLQFKLVRLGPFASVSATASDKNRQNLLAHWCFGSDKLRQLPSDPFIFDEDYPGLSLIDPADVTPCDLPLAVLYWRQGGIAFVDAWAVRRRPIHPGALESWRGLLSDRRVADAQARFLQFQTQLDQLLPTQASSLRAADYFRYLPPVGFLPIKPPLGLVVFLAQELLKQWNNETKIATGKARFTLHSGSMASGFSTATSSTNIATLLMQHLPSTGVDLQKFFDDALPNEVQLIDGESVDYYLQRSWHDAALDLSNEPLFHIYVVGDVWRRLVGNALIAAIKELLAGTQLPAETRKLLLDRLDRIKLPAATGVPDRPYAMFVKHVRHKIHVPLLLTPPPPKGITGSITVWHTLSEGSAAGNVLNALVADARKQNPNAQIELLAIPNSELADRLQSAVAGGEGPDLVLATSDRLGDWTRNSIVQSINQLHQQDPAMLPQAYTGMRIGNQLYGIPESLQAVALLYDRKRVAEPPANLDQLAKLARELKAMASFDESPYYLFGFFTAFGGQVLDAFSRCKAAQTGFGEAMSYLKLVQKLGAVFRQRAEQLSAYKEGQVALTIEGPWMLNELRQTGKIDWGVAPLPLGSKQPGQPLLVVHGYFLVANSDNPENSVRLAERLTDAPAQKRYADEASAVPANSQVQPVDDMLAAFRDAYGQTAPWLQAPQFANFWGPFTAMATKVLDSNADPQKAVVDACQEMDKANGF